jgi:hypothetical protein
MLRNVRITFTAVSTFVFVPLFLHNLLIEVHKGNICNYNMYKNTLQTASSACGVVVSYQSS